MSRSSSSRRLAPLASAALVALAALASGCKRAPTATVEPAPPSDAAAMGTKPITVDPALLASGRVKTAVAERRAPAGELRVAGEVRSSESGGAEVGTLVSGRIASLEVEEGAAVKRGQVLAWVDAPEVAHAAADVLRARARSSVAARKLQRQLDLEKQQATSKNAVDEARAEDETARADLAAARTLLASLGGQEPPADSDATAFAVRVPVRAPIAGVVARRDAILGGPVSPDRTLFRVVAAKEVTVAARIPETTSPRPTAGARATIESRGEPKRRCGGAVSGSLGVVDEATRTLTLRLEPDAECTWLIPGGYVDVVFPVAADAAAPELVVPRDAIVEIKGVPCVFVRGARDEEFVARPVRVRSGLGPDAVIESGIAAGDRVAVAGTSLLKGELLRAELEGQ